MLYLRSALLAFCLISNIGADEQLPEPIVSEGLRRFHDTLATPRLIDLGNDVYAAFAYDYANFGFIETENGVVVVDAGWFGKSMQNALADLHRHTDKQVIAIIYTHAHFDHTGGAGAAGAFGKQPVEVYARAGAFEAMEEDVHSRVSEAVVRRSQAQVGMQLQQSRAFGTAIGPLHNLNSETLTLRPTQDIRERTTIEIDGVQLELIPVTGDLKHSLMVWVPERKTLFAGDTLGGVFPYMQTPRGEPDRDARGMAESVAFAVTLEPEAVIPGHGRIMTNRADAEDVLSSTRDVMLFTLDQVERAIIKGQTSDEIVDSFNLPKHLAEHPDLQPHYHKIDWVIRGLVAQRLGWFQDYLDLAEPNGVEETRQLLKLMGGEGPVLDAARSAFEKAEYRWAAKLASMVHLIHPENNESLQIRHLAFERIAQTTDSSNEANFLRTAIAEESGKLDWGPALSNRLTSLAQGQSDSQLIGQFGTRLKVEDIRGDETFRVALSISDGAGPRHYLSLSNSALEYFHLASAIDSDETTLTMSRDTLVQLFARRTSWAKAIDEGRIRVDGNSKVATRLSELLE